MSKKGLSGIFSNVLLKISKKESSRTGLFFGFVCSIVAMYLFMGGFFNPLDNYLTSLFLQVEYYQPEHQDLIVVAKKDQATSELIQKNPGRQEFASLFEILGQDQTIKRPGGGKARPFSFFTLMFGFLKNIKEPIIRNSMVDYWGYTAKNLEFFSKNPQVGGVYEPDQA